MKKFSIEEIKDVDLSEIVIESLANSQDIDDCENDEELDKHREEMEKVLSNYTYPCLLKMTSNLGRVDYLIVHNVNDVIEYSGEALNNKSGVNMYWGEDNEPIIKVFGPVFQRKDDKSYHFLTQYVKLFNLNQDIETVGNYIEEKNLCHN